METISSKEIDGNIDGILTQVISSSNPLVITGENGSSVVMLSLDEFNSLRETLYLLSNPANAAHLQKSIAELENGKGISVNLADL